MISNNNIIARLPGNQVLVRKPQDRNELSDTNKEALDELKKRDKKVKKHEAGHTGNPDIQTIGTPRYKYTLGPDGKMYAVGGEVTLSTGRVSNPQDALRKATALKKASLSSDDPSPADFAAASAASQMKAEALLQRGKETNPYSQYLQNIKENKNSIDITG
jgi:hypothetical protein